ncbi:EamA family transporter [Halosegnis sp.]|uniref:EamA family transporter n=1 Tax=Halosegnis sp. TaxID=2864959 RepID=UPI0035D4920C
MGIDPSAVLALTAALAFALYTVVVEKGLTAVDDAGDASPALAAAFYFTVVACVVFWALAGARGLNWSAFSLETVWPFVIAGVAYPALFRFLYYESIDRVGAAVSSAIMGAYPAVSALAAVAALGEVLPSAAGIGIALIVGGVGLLQLTQTTDDGAGRDVVRQKLAAASPLDFLFPVCTMLLTGSAFVLIKFGLDSWPGDPVTATALTQTPALVIFGAWALTPAGRRQLRVPRAALYAFLAASACNIVGWLGQFYALNLGTVVTVVPLLNTIPLLVLAFSYIAARQLPRSPRVIGAVLAIIVGVTLVRVPV